VTDARIARRVTNSRVYSTAQGPLAPVAERFSQRARRHRVEQFLHLAAAGPGTRIVDIGCGSVGLKELAPELDVTGVDVSEQPDYPGPFVRADATERLPFSDDEFDLAYANSVIEHVAPGKRAAFAYELRRVASGWYVQTPAVGFPIEPHSLLPAAHWLPRSWRRRYWQLGASGSDPDTIQLLRRGELESLFGPAFPERFGALAKSWIVFRKP
jgi:SAM-dependent methyltransferase